MLIEHIKKINLATTNSEIILAASKCLEILYTFSQIHLYFDKNGSDSKTMLKLMHNIFCEFNTRILHISSLTHKATLLRAMCDINSSSNYSDLRDTDQIVNKNLVHFFESTGLYDKTMTLVGDTTDQAYLLHNFSKDIEDNCVEYTQYSKIIYSWIADIDNNGHWNHIDAQTAFHRLEILLPHLAYNDDYQEASLAKAYKYYSMTTNIEKVSIDQLSAMSKASFTISQCIPELTNSATTLADAAKQHLLDTPIGTHNWWKLQMILTQQWFITQNQQIQTQLAI